MKTLFAALLLTLGLAVAAPAIATETCCIEGATCCVSTSSCCQ